MTDSPKHKGQRRQLIKLLEKKGINDKAILNAMGTVPRHLFMDSGLNSVLYISLIIESIFCMYPI